MKRVLIQKDKISGENYSQENQKQGMDLHFLILQILFNSYWQKYLNYEVKIEANTKK